MKHTRLPDGDRISACQVGERPDHAGNGQGCRYRIEQRSSFGGFQPPPGHHARPAFRRAVRRLTSVKVSCSAWTLECAWWSGTSTRTVISTATGSRGSRRQTRFAVLDRLAPPSGWNVSMPVPAKRVRLNRISVRADRFKAPASSPSAHSEIGRPQPAGPAGTIKPERKAKSTAGRRCRPWPPGSTGPRSAVRAGRCWANNARSGPPGRVLRRDETIRQ